MGQFIAPLVVDCRYRSESTLQIDTPYGREQIRTLPNAVCLAPGSMRWQIFMEFMEQINARGNDIPEAYYAALAIIN